MAKANAKINKMTEVKTTNEIFMIDRPAKVLVPNLMLMKQKAYALSSLVSLDLLCLALIEGKAREN
jgi:hypothetical protein